MPKLTLLVFLVIPIFSCTDHRQKSVKSHENDVALQTVPDTMNYNTAPKAQEEPAILYHFTFDSSKTEYANLQSGWVDSFSLNKQSFQLRLDTATKSDQSFSVEQKKAGKWTRLFNLNVSNDGYGKFDINRDGYVDFIRNYHSSHYIYFFNPSTKTLIDAPVIMPEYYGILDESNFILYNHYDAIYGNPYESSELYTYKGLSPYFYYRLQKEEDDISHLQKINLYRFRNGKRDDMVFVKTMATGKELSFDYLSFWKKLRLQGGTAFFKNKS